MESEKRKLAYVATIDKISSTVQPADNIVVASIGLWNCVVGKNFRVGDRVIYISIDSVLDLANPIFSTYKLENKRIRTIKLRGSQSQGLVIKIEELLLMHPTLNIDDLKEDDDVTDLLGITKYIMPDEAFQYSSSTKEDDPTKIKITTIIESTDEPRIQNYKNISDIKDRKIVVTKKMDGCSCTFMTYDNKFYIAGRNYIWNKDDPNATSYFVMADKLKIEEKMIAKGGSLAIRGELVGPKINGGKTGCKKLQFMVFNIYDFDTRKYLNYCESMQLCSDLDLDYVPVVYAGHINEINTVPMYSFFNTMNLEFEQQSDFKKHLFDNFMKIAEMKEHWYTSLLPSEGIVVKTDDNQERMSFKVISNHYLTKYKL